MLSDRHGQWALVEILVVVAILLLLGWIVLSRTTGLRSGTGEEQVATPKQRAQGVDCANNLRQIRMAIDMYGQTSDNRFPASLADLGSSGISAGMTKCAVSGTPYGYDADSGKVWCATPGHERY